MNSHLSYPPAQGATATSGDNRGSFKQSSKDDGTPVNTPNVMPLVRAIFEFKSDDPDDLPFSKGEILEVIEKPEENWWNARNSQGRIGQIPVPYIEVYVPNKNSTPGAYQSPGVAQVPCQYYNLHPNKVGIKISVLSPLIFLTTFNVVHISPLNVDNTLTKEVLL